PLAYDGVVAFGELGDELVGLREAGGPLYLRIRRAPAAVDDVLANRAVEQEHVLAYQSDGASQILELQLLNRPAVERDAPLFDLVESEQELHQSALTRSGGADDS